MEVCGQWLFTSLLICKENINDPWYVLEKEAKRTKLLWIVNCHFNNDCSSSVPGIITFLSTLIKSSLPLNSLWCSNCCTCRKYKDKDTGVELLDLNAERSIASAQLEVEVFVGITRVLVFSFYEHEQVLGWKYAND